GQSHDGLFGLGLEPVSHRAGWGRQLEREGDLTGVGDAQVFDYAQALDIAIKVWVYDLGKGRKDLRFAWGGHGLILGPAGSECDRDSLQVGPSRVQSQDPDRAISRDSGRRGRDVDEPGSSDGLVAPAMSVAVDAEVEPGRPDVSGSRWPVDHADLKPLEAAAHLDWKPGGGGARCHGPRSGAPGAGGGPPGRAPPASPPRATVRRRLRSARRRSRAEHRRGTVPECRR